MNGIGQDFKTQRTMIVFVDEAGKAHAWDVGPGRALWEWTGLSAGGRSTAKVCVEGEFHRRTRNLEQMRRMLE